MAARYVRSFQLRLSSNRAFTGVTTSPALVLHIQHENRQEFPLISSFSSRLFSTSDENSSGEKKRVVFLGTPEVAATTL